MNAFTSLFTPATIRVRHACRKAPALPGALLAVVLIRRGGTGAEAPVGALVLEPAVEEGGA